MTTAHIYTLSRLVHAGPRSWEQLLASIEEGKSYAFSYYLPMREAVAHFCASRGQRRDQIVREMIARARASGGIRRANRTKDNLDAFETFEEVFFPEIDRFRKNFLHEKQPGCEFEGLTLQGAPHFEVVDSDGRKRHVFLHAAKNWSREDLLAYLELLGIVIEKNYGGDSRSLWVMDLKAGEEIRWRSSARVRKNCRAAARLYGRLISTTI